MTVSEWICASMFPVKLLLLLLYVVCLCLFFFQIKKNKRNSLELLRNLNWIELNWFCRFCWIFFFAVEVETFIMKINCFFSGLKMIIFHRCCCFSFLNRIHWYLMSFGFGKKTWYIYTSSWFIHMYDNNNNDMIAISILIDWLLIDSNQIVSISCSQNKSKNRLVCVCVCVIKSICCFLIKFYLLEFFFSIESKIFGILTFTDNGICACLQMWMMMMMMMDLSGIYNFQISIYRIDFLFKKKIFIFVHYKC